MTRPGAKKHLLIVGAGSVGKRHLRNFAALGVNVSAIDPRADRLEEAKREIGVLQGFATLEQALARSSDFDGVVICSPPSAHVEQSLNCLRARLPLLIEKPLSPSLAEGQRLAHAAAATDVRTVLGYTYRWWPPLSDLKAALRAGEIGKPLHVRCVMSAHLADWHPWEPYQEFFMAKAALGGGALLDESHFLDLMLWFFGVPDHVYARVERLSNLQIDTDDNVDAVLEYDSGLRVLIHLDLFGRPHEKSIRIAGDNGTIEWTFDPNELRIGRDAEDKWQSRRYQHERNDMFVGVAKEFLAVLDGAAQPTCTIQDGVDVLTVIEAMRESSDSGQRVRVASRR